MYDTTIGSRFTNPRFKKLYGDQAMPETGDNVAKEFGVSREQADEFALASQKKYAKAEAEGFYKGEILPVNLPSKKTDAPPTVVVAGRASAPRRDHGIAREAQAALRRRRGHRRQRLRASTTAPRRSSLRALDLGRKERQETHRENPLGRLGRGRAAHHGRRARLRDPEGARARRSSRSRTWTSSRSTRPSPARCWAASRLMKVDFKDPRVNPNGGAIAIGHPLGCSGARLALTVSRQLQETGAQVRRGVAVHRRRPGPRRDPRARELTNQCRSGWIPSSRATGRKSATSSTRGKSTPARNRLRATSGVATS